jgi:hypothetical protein
VAEDKDTDRYLEVLRRWCTPEDLERLLKLLGSPRNAEEFHAALTTMTKRNEWWSTARSLIKEQLAWIVLITAAVFALRDLLPWLAERLSQ